MGVSDFIEIVILFIEDLKKKGVSYDEAIIKLKKTKEIIEKSEKEPKNHTNYDKNQEEDKGENKENVVEDRKDDKN